MRSMLRRPINPVLARELKERMRRRRSTLVLTVYLLLLGGALWLLYLGSSTGLGGPGALRLASLGRAAFQTLLFAMLLLVCFIVPGLAAGGVAGERERETLLPLQVTLLRPRSILLGKLAASVVFVAFLVVAALPLIGVSFLLGGVEPGEVVRGVAMVLVVAAMLGSLALTCSTLMRRVQGATVVSYALVAALVGGTFVAFGAQMLVDRDHGLQGRSQLILALNPLMATADVLSRSSGEEFRVPSPFTPLQMLIAERQHPPGQMVMESGVEFGAGVARPVPMPAVLSANDVLDSNGQPVVPGAAPAAWRPPLQNRIPMWVLALGGYGLLSVGGLALASRRLATPSES